MKNKIELKKYIISTLIVFICLFILFLFLNIYEYKTYTKNFNNKISAIINVIKKDYPKITDNYLIIKNFKSNSRIKGEESSTISMVLIDYNYDGKTFDLDEVLFESDFKEQKAKFDSSKIKKQAMLIFVDDSGNEKKVIVNE